MSFRRRSDPRKTAELERRIAAEDERLERIEQARTDAELQAALEDPAKASTKAAVLAQRRPMVRAGAVLLAAVFFVALAAAANRSDGAVDWSAITVGTDDPFASAVTASVYLVPLDRPAWDDDGGFSLASLRARLEARRLRVVITPPLAIGPAAFDQSRRQLDGDSLVSLLAEHYEQHAAPDRRAVVIGVTSLDEFSPSFFGERFVFVYRQPRTSRWSVMHDPIRGLGDLD